MKTVLGIDLGTQSLKAVFYDYEQKQFAAVVSAPLEVDRDQSGKAEQHVGWWLSALAACCRQVSPTIRASVQALAVSGQQHGFVALDAGGSVLAPVKLWCDTTTQVEADEIMAACGGRDQTISLCGNPMLTGYTAPKIRWFKKFRPALYEQMAHILLPHDFLNFVLTGVYSMEYGDASGTGLLDVHTRQWSAELLKAVDADRDLSACLPTLHDSKHIVGRTTRADELAFGLPAGILVATGGGDNMMGAIGTGNVKAGELTISLGSSGTLYAWSAKPVIDPAGNIAAFCSSDGNWLPLLCTMNCTLATELMRNLLDIDLAQFEAMVASVPPGCDGLVTLPFFNGERTPNLPSAKACVIGLDSHNCSKAHLLRSTMEAASFTLKSGLDDLKRLGIDAKEITLTGGGSKSAQWRQLIADLFQLPVRVLQGDEGAGFGAALQALWVLQLQDNPNLTLNEVCKAHIRLDTQRCTQPDPAKAVVYAAAYAEYQRVLQQVSPLYAPGQPAVKASPNKQAEMLVDP